MLGVCVCVCVCVCVFPGISHWLQHSCHHSPSLLSFLGFFSTLTPHKRVFPVFTESLRSCSTYTRCLYVNMIMLAAHSSTPDLHTQAVEALIPWPADIISKHTHTHTLFVKELNTQTVSSLFELFQRKSQLRFLESRMSHFLFLTDYSSVVIEVTHQI